MRTNEFSRKTKAAALIRAAGKCEQCAAKLSKHKFEFHHIKEVEVGGDASLQNCLVVCVSPCHTALTKTFVAGIRKADRSRAADDGTAREPSRPMPAGRDSFQKKTMSGRTVERVKSRFTLLDHLPRRRMYEDK